ncbi:hypothetical protein EV586_103127 [Tumebacillus sp. BK434]|uniref:hypothetical protein n=1 Tax=Tumebacillus sp. BK434 TaxID=2512169 RepID=UPI001047B8C2|nr:hypothetical protein [Tumebacillus sp. BK434]TCP55475.1 hypothetical protein EV586_103127 [Tumebacillus sp. BK434]
MTHEQLLAVMQHTPLPERMGNFERTRSPQQTEETGSGLVFVEYSHLSEDVQFQAVLRGEQALLQVVQNGAATPVRELTIEEVGHVLRADLLMMLEDLEDEL